MLKHNHRTIKTITILAIVLGGVIISDISQADELNTISTTFTEQTTSGDDVFTYTDGSGSGSGGTCPLGIPLLCGWW